MSLYHMTIGDNIVETMSVNKTIHSPSPLSFKVVLLGCLLFSTGSLNSSTTLHGGGGGGGGGGAQEGKLYFPFWSWQEAHWFSHRLQTYEENAIRVCLPSLVLTVLHLPHAGLFFDHNPQHWSPLQRDSRPAVHQLYHQRQGSTFSAPYPW